MYKESSSIFDILHSSEARIISLMGIQLDLKKTYGTSSHHLTAVKMTGLTKPLFSVSLAVRQRYLDCLHGSRRIGCE